MSPVKHPKHSWVTDFLNFQFGEASGQVRLATLDKGSDFKEFMAEWPKHKDTIAEWALAQSMQGKDVYYTPALYLPADKAVEKNRAGKTAGTRANIQSSQVVWVDLDGNAPENWTVKCAELGIPEPSVIIQSSVKGNEHVYWRLDEHKDAEQVESINRSLALRVGADNSGWDATQLLRIPFTQNYGHKGAGRGHKEWFSGESVEVSVSAQPRPERLEAANFDSVKIDFDSGVERRNLSALPDLFNVLTARSWSDSLRETFQLTKEEASDRSPHKRSGSLQRLAYEAAEAGFKAEEIYVLVENADTRWEKYSSRNAQSRHNIIMSMVTKALDNVVDNADLFKHLAQETTSDNLQLFFGFEDFMSADIEPVEWIFDGLLQRESFGFITAQPGVGKTQLSLQLSLSAALGKNFIMHDCAAGKQKVLYFSLEMMHAELMDTLRIMTKEFGPEARRTLQKNFSIVPSDSVDRMALDTDLGRQLFEHLLDNVKPDIVIIDSLSEILSKSVNDDETALNVSSYFNNIRKKKSTSIVVIHHNRKISNEAKKNGRTLELSDLYGSQWWSAKCQWVVAVRKTEDRNILGYLSLKMRATVDFNYHIRRHDDLSFTQTSEAGGDDHDVLLIGAPNATSGDSSTRAPDAGRSSFQSVISTMVRDSPAEPGGSPGVSEPGEGEANSPGHGDDGP